MRVSSHLPNFPATSPLGKFTYHAENSRLLFASPGFCYAEAYHSLFHLSRGTMDIAEKVLYGGMSLIVATVWLARWILN
jgi:hypothetical protein